MTTERKEQSSVEALAQPERHELQADGKHPAPCARFCEANAFQIEIRNLKAQLAQPEHIPPSAYSNTHQPEPPPECQTEAEKIAFAFGWFKAMESQRKPLRDEMRKQMKESCDSNEMRGAFADGWLSAEAAHGIKD